MKILLCGNYGATNLGDELILKGLIQFLHKKNPILEIIVLSNNPKETEKLHNVHSVYFLPCGFRSLKRSFLDLEIIKTLKAYLNSKEFILGGGGLFQDHHPYAIFIWGLHFLVAFLLRKKIRILGNSLGPLTKWWSRKIVKFIFNHADEIKVRDELSFQLLKKIGVKKNIQIIEDFAISLKSLKINKFSNYSKSVNKKNYIILSLLDFLKGEEKEKFETEIIKICNFLIQERGFEIIALPFQKLIDDDEAYLASIKEKIENKKSFHVQKFSSDFNKIFDLYLNANLIIGMRLHSIILAHKFNKPFIALNYNEKVMGFCKSIRKEENCFNIEKFTRQNILKKIN
jgi:polysaccharide pyruvyl transferase CsaB